jgi:hypothetical protein
MVERAQALLVKADKPVLSGTILVSGFAVGVVLLTRDSAMGVWQFAAMTTQTTVLSGTVSHLSYTNAWQCPTAASIHEQSLTASLLF